MTSLTVYCDIGNYLAPLIGYMESSDQIKNTINILSQHYQQSSDYKKMIHVRILQTTTHREELMQRE